MAIELYRSHLIEFEHGEVHHDERLQVNAFSAIYRIGTTFPAAELFFEQFFIDFESDILWAEYRREGFPYNLNDEVA
jgi:hypothetical protein